MKPGLISLAERHLRDITFAFSLELASGRVPGLSHTTIQRAIDFDHELVNEDYPVTDALFKALKKFATTSLFSM